MNSFGFELINDDCITAMKNMGTGTIDMLFTDLPYGTTRCKWDIPIDLNCFWLESNRVVKSGGCKALFAQTPFDKVLGCSNLKQLRYEWIWEKTTATGYLNANRMPLKAHENILIFYDRLPTYNPQMTHGHVRKVVSADHKRNCRMSDIYNEYGMTSYDSTDRYPRDVLKGTSDRYKCSLHPTQKPVWLCEQMILTYTNPGELILDCCMGSASIGVACKNTGRRYIGIDIEKKWFEVAKERLQMN